MGTGLQRHGQRRDEYTAIVETLPSGLAGNTNNTPRIKCESQRVCVCEGKLEEEFNISVREEDVRRESERDYN